MTDFEKFFEEVRNDPAIEDFEVYETVDNKKVVKVYLFPADYEDHIYTLDGKFVETQEYHF